MSLIPAISALLKWRQFEPKVILRAVGWYLRFSLSYRDMEELLQERGIAVDHVTLWGLHKASCDKTYSAKQNPERKEAMS